MKKLFLKRYIVAWIIFVTFIVSLQLFKLVNVSTINPLNVSQEPKIVVLTVVSQKSDLSKYITAQSTLKCYCKMNNYTFYQHIIENDQEMKKKCSFKDIMFTRHCIVREVLQENPDIDYLLFLDADMGVVNPNHRIEDYIDPAYDLIFYERFMNSEIAGGSYIIKNTQYAQDFLKAWTDYEVNLPNSFHGRDNSALHAVLQQKFNPNHPYANICRQIWEDSKNWTGVHNYVVCVRSLLNNVTLDKIKVIPKKSLQTWTRDAWLTQALWSDRDFILHEWKEINLGYPWFEGWQYPFRSKAILKHPESCSEKSWDYIPKYKRSDEIVKIELEKVFLRADLKHFNATIFIKENYNISLTSVV